MIAGNRVKWIAFSTLICQAFAGCAGGGVQIPKEVGYQVSVACVDPKDRPERPALLSDAELLALDTYRRTWALWGARLEILGYTRKLEAIVDGCSRLPTPESNR